MSFSFGMRGEKSHLRGTFWRDTVDGLSAHCHNLGVFRSVIIFNLVECLHLIFIVFKSATIGSWDWPWLGEIHIFLRPVLIVLISIQIPLWKRVMCSEFVQVCAIYSKSWWTSEKTEYFATWLWFHPNKIVKVIHCIHNPFTTLSPSKLSFQHSSYSWSLQNLGHLRGP